jgi:Holliday junction resolvase RusA-like endonuclease
MNELYSFTVSGDPKGQPRPRAFAMRMPDGKYSARVFDSGTAEGWKAQVVLAAKPHAPARPLAGPVQVRIAFVFRRPNSHFRSSNPAKELRGDAPTYHTSKPDSDNLAKAVLDALTQLGTFWRDDSQVCSLFAGKTYGPNPGAVVEIISLAEHAKAAATANPS